MNIKEEAPTMSVASGAVKMPPDAVSPDAMPSKRKRGMFACYETVILARETFNSLRVARSKHKHWRKYLKDDPMFEEVKQIAYSTKGPIVVECDTTGACMFVRFGEGDSLFEAVENSVTKNDKGWLSDAGKKARDVRRETKINYGKEKYLGTFRGHHVRKTTDPGGGTAYHLQDPKTGDITHSVNGSQRNGVLKIGGASSTGTSKVKMEDFYHHLLKKHLNALDGRDHSEGAKKVWQRLSSKPGVSVHGYHNGKAVNLDPKDESETHAPRKGSSLFRDEREPEEKEVAKTSLIASYHKRGAKKL